MSKHRLTVYKSILCKDHRHNYKAPQTNNRNPNLTTAIIIQILYPQCNINQTITMDRKVNLTESFATYTQT